MREEGKMNSKAFFVTILLRKDLDGRLLELSGHRFGYDVSLWQVLLSIVYA